MKHGRFSYLSSGSEGEADANQDGKISAGELTSTQESAKIRGCPDANDARGCGRWVLQ